MNGTKNICVSIATTAKENSNPIIGAKTKAAALSPTVTLYADLSRVGISLRNRLIHNILSSCL